MKVRMLVDISGTHNGVSWPPAGEVADVPDELGEKLLANGQAAKPRAKQPEASQGLTKAAAVVETATKDDDTETPEPKTTRARKSG